MRLCWSRYSSARMRALMSRVISSPSSTESARSPQGRNRGSDQIVTGRERSERRERVVRQVGDEHVPRAVGDHERRLRGQRHRLRRHPAGPEYRHLARANAHRITPVGLVDVSDAEGRRVADVHGGAVGAGEARRGGHRLRDEAGRDRPHRDDHGPVELAGGPARHRGLPHRHVLALVDVTHRDARVEQGPLEGERAAEQEGDEIVAPERAHIGDLVGEHAVLVDAVPGNVRAQIGPRGYPHGLGRAHVGYLDQRAGPRVALAEEQEVVGLFLRQHREVGLHEAGGQPGGDAGEPARPDVGPDLLRVARVDRHLWCLSRRPVYLRCPSRGQRSALASTCGFSPRSTRSISAVTWSAIPRMLSRVTPAIWGETITFSSWKNRLSEDAGSSSNTSMPAARILPLSSPATSAASSWVLPREVFTKITPSFIWATAAASIM